MAIQKEIRTALSAAWFRAYHHTHITPKIFDDAVAPLLLTTEEDEFFSNHRIERLKNLDPAIVAMCPDRATMLREFMPRVADAAEMLSRARYCEDKLEEAVGHGVRQYVLIGAGMDSFAFRRPDLNQHLQVFEIDRPRAQDFKCQRLMDAGLKLPANLHFVPVDFTEENVDAGLIRSAFDPQVSTFFGWMGATPYLDRDTVLGTVEAIKQVAARGSYLVFDYLHTDAFDPGKAAPRVQELISRLQNFEPLSSGFEPRELETALKHRGFHTHEHLGPDDIQTRYFQGRTDGYYATEHAHFVCAVVES